MARAYYNEIDSFAAQWLRNLIAEGHIADGDVDTRSITDVSPDDVRGYDQCHWFAGIGGWSLALRLAGWDDTRPVWNGSCPCQPFSQAGKREGAADDRNLWPFWSILIRECAPPVVFGEQVASAISHGWLDAVFDDLESEKYACGAIVLPACGVGAPHIRQRLWFVADRNDEGLEVEREQQARGQREAAERGGEASAWGKCDWLLCRDGKSRPVESGTFPLAHGVPSRVGRLRAYGNAIVPALAAEVIGAFMDCLP